MADTAKRQLRAYLVVTIGSATFQERRTAEKGGDLKFECRPILTNTGETPARNIRFNARAGIYSTPLSKGAYLAEGGDADISESMMGPHQTANLFAVVDGFCADNEVEKIKAGCFEKGLYVWGLITYEDVFGERHFTRFCQQIFWVGDEIRGIYIPGRNDAD